MSIVERVLGSNVVLLWLDEHICKANTCIELKDEFKSSTGSNIYLFDDVDRCRRFIKKVGRRKKLFCIIQGSHAKTVVPDIIQYAISPVVYIFCVQMFILTEWAQEIRCVLEGGVFGHEKDLLGKLARDLCDYAKLKVDEHETKRAACEEWAQNLTKTAKRFKTEECTLTFATDPTDNHAIAGVESGE